MGPARCNTIARKLDFFHTRGSCFENKAAHPIRFYSLHFCSAWFIHTHTIRRNAKPSIISTVSYVVMTLVNPTPCAQNYMVDPQRPGMCRRDHWSPLRYNNWGLKRPSVDFPLEVHLHDRTHGRAEKSAPGTIYTIFSFATDIFARLIILLT